MPAPRSQLLNYLVTMTNVAFDRETTWADNSPPPRAWTLAAAAEDTIAMELRRSADSDVYLEGLVRDLFKAQVKFPSLSAIIGIPAGRTWNESMPEIIAATVVDIIKTSSLDRTVESQRRKDAWSNARRTAQQSADVVG